MRIAIAGFWLESVTFLPNTTDIPEFERSAKRGAAVIHGFKGTATPQGGLIDVLQDAGADLVGVADAGVGAAAAASDAAYAKYAEGATVAIAEHGGEFIARGGRFVQLEGRARPRNVVARFPDVETAEKCYHSDAYQAALKHAKGASERELMIIETNE